MANHLGNIRVTVDENGDVVSADDYYPFGLQMPGRSYNIGLSGNQYKYNSKELDDENGLNWYSYGARYYDSEIARWHSVDRLRQDPSPYIYTGNNPISRIDNDGFWWIERVHLVPNMYNGRFMGGDYYRINFDYESEMVWNAITSTIIPGLKEDILAKHGEYFSFKSQMNSIGLAVIGAKSGFANLIISLFGLEESGKLLSLIDDPDVIAEFEREFGTNTVFSSKEQAANAIRKIAKRVARRRADKKKKSAENESTDSTESEGSGTAEPISTKVYIKNKMNDPAWNASGENDIDPKTMWDLLNPDKEE